MDSDNEIYECEYCGIEFDGICFCEKKIIEELNTCFIESNLLYEKLLDFDKKYNRKKGDEYIENK